ncbi:MAG TPA: hypothetical protein VEW92_04890 [Nitrososphaeraceae archaeon]|nr:hypothetical protein [Nitrososphaeraceae archaeon]
MKKRDIVYIPFTDSTKALNCFKKDNYDLVLLDSKIPKLKEGSL